MCCRQLTSFFLLFPVWLAAQTLPDSAASNSQPAATEPISMGWVLLKTMGVLVLILVLIVVSVYLLKKYVFAPVSGARQSDWIQVLGQIQIQPKKYVTLVKALDRVLLIGLTDGAMVTLAEFTDPVQVQTYLDKFTQNSGNWSDNRFLAMFRKNLEA